MCHIDYYRKTCYIYRYESFKKSRCARKRYASKWMLQCFFRFFFFKKNGFLQYPSQWIKIMPSWYRRSLLVHKCPFKTNSSFSYTPVWCFISPIKLRTSRSFYCICEQVGTYHPSGDRSVSLISEKWVKNVTVINQKSTSQPQINVKLTKFQTYLISTIFQSWYFNFTHGWFLVALWAIVVEKLIFGWSLLHFQLLSQPNINVEDGWGKLRLNVDSTLRSWSMPTGMFLITSYICGMFEKSLTGNTTEVVLFSHIFKGSQLDAFSP